VAAREDVPWGEQHGGVAVREDAARLRITEQG
jgi:hypothetical protein